MSATDYLHTLLDDMQARCDESMNAYYYSFEGTGIVPIDRVLSMVARAGKGSHHTDMWQDDKYGPSHEQRIQEAANESADKVRRLLAAVNAALTLAEAWRYKGEYGDGPWQLGEGPDESGWALNYASSELRAAVRAALIGDDDE